MAKLESGPEKYSLLDMIITVENRKITASEYIYYKNEEIIREISHPAEIDVKNNILVIHKCSLRGHDTELSLADIKKQFMDLPRWKITKYYQINDNRKNDIYLTRVNLMLRNSRKTIRYDSNSPDAICRRNR